MVSEEEANLHSGDWLWALDQAAEMYGEGGEARVPAMFHSLRVAIDRLTEAGAQKRQLLPLTALLHALDRLNHGKSVGILKPRKGSFDAIQPDRVEGAATVRQAQALAVEEAIYRALGAARGKRREAQRKAAAILAKHGFKTRAGHPLTHDIIRQLRSDLTDRGREFDSLRSAYEDYMAMVPGEPCIEWAEEFAATVAKHPAFQMS